MKIQVFYEHPDLILTLISKIFYSCGAWQPSELLSAAADYFREARRCGIILQN